MMGVPDCLGILSSLVNVELANGVGCQIRSCKVTIGLWQGGRRDASKVCGSDCIQSLFDLYFYSNLFFVVFVNLVFWEISNIDRNIGTITMVSIAPNWNAFVQR